jgi:hypothetical protein
MPPMRNTSSSSNIKDLKYLLIAVRRRTIRKSKKTGKQKEERDYEKVCKYFDGLYTSKRLQHMLRGMLILGY